MASLSQVDPTLSPNKPHSSLLTGDTSQRTLRVYRSNNEDVTPTEVTRFCKANGSGKLGRIAIQEDGSAVLDLPTKRAERLCRNIQAVADESDDDDVLDGWTIEIPMRL
eukprot:CAMPEP_0202463664 /NCGR_PEP_ID=MMETSP1360-20130828/59083_1 /ASSEMBLY_ACC=CAM_ASM_000848 /TAXON_ID=515479 /ORGANISM="Licmophora paradoxa, Strain CCMP2313" /LENGTH=108 /DNA_ID=CAMNT_0049086659 /DNA_START=162 /DNA_END=488 /DNA_ORIENTATION=+